MDTKFIFLRLALLDILRREKAQGATTCWVRSSYAPVMPLAEWVEKVLAEADALGEPRDNWVEKVLAEADALGERT